MSGVIHHTNYHCDQEIERLQIYSGSMARADPEKDLPEREKSFRSSSKIHTSVSICVNSREGTDLRASISRHVTHLHFASQDTSTNVITRNLSFLPLLLPVRVTLLPAGR